MKKIKILFVMDHFHFSSGGTEGQIYTLIKKLDRKTFEPQVCLFRHETDYFKKEMFPCPVFCQEIKSFFSFTTYGKFLQLRRYIRQNKIDIVQSIFNDSALSLAFYTFGLGVKTISTRRDMGFWYTPAKLCILRMNTFFTDKYLVNSHAVKDNIHRKEWVPVNKVIVIPNGCDVSRFHIASQGNFRERYAIPEGAPIIGIVANLRPVKRVNDLIMAFPRVLEKIPESYLVIVGYTGELLDKYMHLANDLRIEERVKFLGLINDPIPVINNFSVGVNCSESEGLSNAIIEYMGCRIPVVATDTAGNREMIIDGKTGLLVPVGDTCALSTSIVRLLKNEELRDNVVSRARESLLTRFDEKQVIKQYEYFYIEIVGVTDAHDSKGEHSIDNSM